MEGSGMEDELIISRSAFHPFFKNGGALTSFQSSGICLLASEAVKIVTCDVAWPPACSYNRIGPGPSGPDAVSTIFEQVLIRPLGCFHTSFLFLSFQDLYFGPAPPPAQVFFLPHWYLLILHPYFSSALITLTAPLLHLFSPILHFSPLLLSISFCLFAFSFFFPFSPFS